MITLNDLTAISICIATDELFDTKRFIQNFCDNLLLRDRDAQLEPMLRDVKNKLNNQNIQKTFFDGHKAIIINNIDKILSVVSSRYSKIDMKSVENITKECKILIKKIVIANNFPQIAELQPVFKSKVFLPTYQLFLKSIKV